MSHEATGVPRVEDPADTFSESVTRVDSAFDMLKKDMTSAFPVLNGEILDVDVARAFGRASSIDHFDGRFVVLIEDSRGFLREPELVKDKAEILRNFSCSDGGNELGFGGAGSGDRLGLGTVSDDAASVGKTIARSGAALAEVIAMGGINITRELEGIKNKGERRKSGRVIRRLVNGSRKVGIGLNAPILYAPRDGGAKIFCHAFEAAVMDFSRVVGEFGEGSDRIADVGASGDVRVE